MSYFVSHRQSFLNAREETITGVFTEGLRYYYDLTTYFNDEHQDDLVNVARALPIWRKPVPNLDSPTV